MAFSTLANLVLMTTATSGTGTVTLGSVVTGFIAVPASLDGKSVTYELSDPGTNPTAREVGRGVYTNSGTTLTRVTVLASTNGGSKISLSGSAYVSLTLADDDIQNLNPTSVTMQVASAASSGEVVLCPGGGQINPLTFTSGTNLTSAQNGACEYDGNTLMFTPSSQGRGAVPAKQFASLTGSYVLTSTTSAQKLFNVPSSGSLTVAASTRYMFEGVLYITGMSGTSGNTGFDIIGAGTATFTSALWAVAGLDSTTPTTAAAVGGCIVASNSNTVNIVTAATGTGLFATLSGQFRVNQGGTIIPSVDLTTAAAATVQPDTYFACWPVSTANATSIGNWA